MSHIPVCLGVFRVKLLHTAVQYERFVEPVKFTEREGLVDKSRHEVRSQVQRPVEPLQRLLVPAELLQSRTDIVTYGGIRRVQCLGPPAVGQSFLKSIEFVQRPATPGQGRRVIRLQLVTQVKIDQSLFEALGLEQKDRVIIRCVPVARIKF